MKTEVTLSRYVQCLAISTDGKFLVSSDINYLLFYTACNRLTYIFSHCRLWEIRTVMI